MKAIFKKMVIAMAVIPFLISGNPAISTAESILPSSIEKYLETAEYPRSASDLVGLCSSVDNEKLSYCDGYIEGATHIWKYWTACSSQELDDQAFCAGVTAAQNKIQEASQELREYEPDRFQQLRNELKAIVGVCTPGDPYDENFCSGYNTKVSNVIAELSVIQPIGIGARDRGLGDAESDVGTHLFASEEFYLFRPCLQVETSPQKVKNVLLEFAHQNSGKQQNLTAIMLLAEALYYNLCPGSAQKLVPHMEQCTVWDYANDKLMTRNNCDEVVVIHFMAEGHDAVKQQLNPGMSFKTGMSRSQLGSGWWMYTTCPAEHISSIPFLPENRKVFVNSIYDCVHE